MYTAATLSEESSTLLKQKLIEKMDPAPLGFIFETKYGQRLPHHATINLGSFNSSLNPPEILNEPAEILVNKFLYNENICCAVVDQIKTKSGQIINCSNKFPHITTCLRPPTRPVESNNLFIGNASTIWINETLLEAFVNEIE